MTVSEIIVYVLLGVFAIGVIIAGVIMRKTMKLKYQACSANKGLFHALLIIGLGAMMCIPEKTSVWVLAAAMYVMLILILKRFRDGVDEKGVVLTGCCRGFDRYETYSVRRLEKITEFRFYRPGSIRMMAFTNDESEDVQRFLASHGMKQKEFQEIRVTAR